MDHEDDQPLQVLLDEYKAAVAIDYGNEKRQLAKSKLSPEEKKQQKESIQRHYEAPLHEVHGIECAGILNMTLGMVKRGCGGIRDRYLLGCWAKENNIDFDVMARQRGELMRYLQTRTGNDAIVSDFRGGLNEKYRSVEPLRFHGENDPRFKVLCASVKYRIEFENEDVAFLFDCSERKALRTEEWKELKEHHGIETAHAKKKQAGQSKGGKVCKVKDPLTRKAIGQEVNKRIGNGQKPTTAAKGVVLWAAKTLNEDINFKTAMAYAEQVRKVEK